MTTVKLIRWSGMVSVLAGLWTVAISLFELGQTGQWVYALSTLLMIFALFGIYAVQIRESGLWGLAFILAGYELWTQRVVRNVATDYAIR